MHNIIIINLYIFYYSSFHNNRKRSFIKEIMMYTNTLYNRYTYVTFV